MLKTATKPKWIAALVLVLIVAGAFVMLSQWQFSRSLEKDVAPPSVTEKVQPLLQTFDPGQPLLGNNEGQLVTLTGHFDASKQVIVDSRMQNGKKGYWSVVAFVVDGAPVLTGEAATKEVVIPVARGWFEGPQKSPALPAGTVSIEGRLLNSEGPVLRENMPEGHVSALSSAELTNRWNVTTYAGFVISNEEMVNGQQVGAKAPDSALTPITVTATDRNKINWLNIFYSVEWVLFAGFAVFIWWRLVADEYRREQDGLFDIDYEADDDAGDADEEQGDRHEFDHEFDHEFNHETAIGKANNLGTNTVAANESRSKAGHQGDSTQ